MSNSAKFTKTTLNRGAQFAVAAACLFVSANALAAYNSAALRGPPQGVSIVAEVQSPLTFQAWKSLRVDEARLVLERLTYESQLEKMPIIDRSPGEKQAVIRTSESPLRVTSPRAPKSSRADSRADQARMNLEIAQDLTMNDYLIIYLSQFKSRDAILDVARRLGPDDIADLLQSYQKLSMGGQIAEHTIAPTPRTPPRPL